MLLQNMNLSLAVCFPSYDNRICAYLLIISNVVDNVNLCVALQSELYGSMLGSSNDNLCVALLSASSLLLANNELSLCSTYLLYIDAYHMQCFAKHQF